MIVVTDTSVVLNLCWLRQESLLLAFFEQVLAPSQVRREFERLVQVDERFNGLSFPHSIQIADASTMPESLRNEFRLDAGEVAALALALDRGIRDILVDERAGRAVALELGLRPSGLLGLLIRAKTQALIPAVLPLLDRLQEGARFRIGERLRARIAALAGE